MTYIETFIGESADKHSAELAEAARSLDEAHKKISGLGDVVNRHDAKHSAHEHHATIQERLTYIEKFMGDSADKHDAEMAEAARSLDEAHKKISGLGDVVNRHDAKHSAHDDHGSNMANNMDAAHRKL